MYRSWNSPLECVAMTIIYPVIMVGGAGTRLWPVSTRKTPKQFQPMISDKSLFQETLLRFQGRFNDVEFRDPIIVGAKIYLAQIEAQMADIGVKPTTIILEPCPRSTTPVAAIAAQLVAGLDKDALAMLVPSDHHIAAPDIFLGAINDASVTAKTGWITTFGILPTRPETGFGYIAAGEKLRGNVSKVSSFTEKPNAELAAKYLGSSNYTWNAGLFLFSPEIMTAELEKFAPDTLSLSIEALGNATKTGGGLLLEAEQFEKCDNVSLDYSIMEKTDHGAVYSPLSCGWSDVGTWQAIAQMRPEQISKGVTSLDNENCFIQTDENTQIAATGLKDLIIVAHKGRVLILPKERSQDVSKLVKQLTQDNKHPNV